MARASPPRRLVSALICFLALAMLLAGCGKKKAAGPVIGGIVGFDQGTASDTNGNIPRADAAWACGSPTAEFGAELATIASPSDAKVPREWGPILPNRPAMYISGTIQDFQFSMGDLTFTHPFGRDVTFNVKPDPPFQSLAQNAPTAVGTDADGPAAGTVHWELERGLFPHQGTGMEDYLPGFIPQDGDRIATYGQWIVDCGHNDYHTEIHPSILTAFGHVEGSATVAHAFYTPYYYTQLLNPDPLLSSELTNEERFKDPLTRTFPQYLVQELLRVGHLGPGTICCHDRIEAHELLAANTISPIDWYVCAPGTKPGGAHLNVAYAFTVRPGVTVTATPDESSGCVAFRATIGPDYIPHSSTRKSCVNPWADLNSQAQAALGDPTIDIKKLIESKVPASFVPAVEQDPIVDCYDPLLVPAPGEAGQAQSVLTLSTNQPFPFYGSITVSWSTSA